MATTEPITSLEVADSLECLSLDSQAKTTKVPEPVKTDFYSDNGSYMYQQTYGYMPYEMYSMPGSPLTPMGHDGQMHAMQEYYYPSPYYQAPLQTSQADASQVEVSTFVASDQASLSVKTNTENSNMIVGGGGLSDKKESGSVKPTSKSSSLNPNASYKRVGLSTGNLSKGHQDSRYGYDGLQPTTIPWLDMSMYSNKHSDYTANGGRPSSGVAQAFGYMNHMYPYGHYGNTVRKGSGFGSYDYYGLEKRLGYYNVGNNNNKSRGFGYGKENMDGLNELNKGPRVKACNNKDGFGTAKLTVKDRNLPLTESNKENSVSLVPDLRQYNKEEFPESYSIAKFFVIKSYSEDDVHKSVKYNVWASTSNGNKKLDVAFREAKEKPDVCPVFLLFSVNTSGQFVGVAEMIGQVDFNKTVEYWQQDKWTGCFPVKWHIIKDVPNMSLRHITLENNENKPVTNSRDTQEINFEQGIQILKIFKDHSSMTCILDDFEFYEARQKTIQEKKAKHQLEKKGLNGERNDIVIDKKENAAIAKDTLEASLIKEPTVAPAEENGSVTGSVVSACQLAS